MARKDRSQPSCKPREEQATRLSQKTPPTQRLHRRQPRRSREGAAAPTAAESHGQAASSWERGWSEGQDRGAGQKAPGGRRRRKHIETTTMVTTTTVMMAANGDGGDDGDKDDDDDDDNDDDD